MDAAVAQVHADNFARNLPIVDAVEVVARRKGITAAQVALAWVLHQGEDIVPIPGTKRVRYLEENVAAIDVTLDRSDLDELATAIPVGATAGNRSFDMATIDV